MQTHTHTHTCSHMFTHAHNTHSMDPRGTMVVHEDGEEEYGGTMVVNSNDKDRDSSGTMVIQRTALQKGRPGLPFLDEEEEAGGGQYGTVNFGVCESVRECVGAFSIRH